MSYPNEPPFTCPTLDKILETIEEARDIIETQVESVRSDNTRLREQAQDHYAAWTDAKDEIATLEAQLDVAHDRISELEYELEEAKKQLSLLRQKLES